MDITKKFLRGCTSLRIGGEADVAVVASEENLREVVEYAKNKKVQLYVLGGGTNSFFKDSILNTLVVKMEIKGIDIKESGDFVLLTVGAGEVWDNVVELTVMRKWWGVENLSHIPGTVGAAPVQNIGAYGAELKDVLFSVRAFDTIQDTFIELSNLDCCFSYRDSLFKKEKGRYIITSIKIKLFTKARPLLTYKPLDSLIGKENLTTLEVRELVIKTRKEKLPDYQAYPNAGSFFKNPVVDKLKAENLKTRYPDAPLYESNDGYKISAAWLIEHIAEMKGVRIGDVGTWPKHPLVIVNYGDANYEDLMLFSAMIVNKIKEKTNIRLEREVNLVE